MELYHLADELEATSCDGRITCSDFGDECGSGCWNRLDYCGLVKDDLFQCPISDNTKASASSNLDMNINSEQVCNLEADCALSKDDEQFCSVASHFYCWSK